MEPVNDQTRGPVEKSIDAAAESQSYDELQAFATAGMDLRRERAINYATAEELAAFVNVTLETFHLLADHAHLCPIEIDGELMYHRTEVKQFLSAWVSWGLRRYWVSEAGKRRARGAVEQMAEEVTAPPATTPAPPVTTTAQ